MGDFELQLTLCMYKLLSRPKLSQPLPLSPTSLSYSAELPIP